jgi:hypothetical protein
MNDKEVIKQAVIDIKKGLDSLLNGIEDSSKYKIEAGFYDIYKIEAAFYAIRESIKSLDEELGLKDDIQRKFNVIEKKLDILFIDLLRNEYRLDNILEDVEHIRKGIKK